MFDVSNLNVRQKRVRPTHQLASIWYKLWEDFICEWVTIQSQKKLKTTWEIEVQQKSNVAG